MTLVWVLIFLIIGFVGAVWGFKGLSPRNTIIKVVCFVLATLFLISLVLSDRLTC